MSAQWPPECLVNWNNNHHHSLTPRDPEESLGSAGWPSYPTFLKVALSSVIMLWKYVHRALAPCWVFVGQQGATLVIVRNFFFQNSKRRRRSRRSCHCTAEKWCPRRKRKGWQQGGWRWRRKIGNGTFIFHLISHPPQLMRGTRGVAENVKLMLSSQKFLKDTADSRLSQLIV